MKKSIDLEIEHAALKFMFTPNSKHPQKRRSFLIMPPSINLTNLPIAPCCIPAMALVSSGYIQHICIRGCKSLVHKKISLPEILDFLGNDTIKGVYVENQLGGYRSLENLNEEIEPVKKYLVTDTMQARYTRAVKRLSTYRKGDKRYDFSYPDSNGNVVRLASLKGKVVLVDVWATWCGPCKAELPHLKKLEEELHEKNIAFVSISVDEEKDKVKWMHFVADQQLGGIQLFAKGYSEFTKYYDIHGIPRFLVFDQDGKIITVDSPRPSTSELKELLLSTLNAQR